MDIYSLIGWIVSAMIFVIDAVIIYYLYKGARAFGGKKGSVLIKLTASIVFLVATATYMGIVVELGLESESLISLIIPLSLGLPAIILTALAARALSSITKE